MKLNFALFTPVLLSTLVAAIPANLQPRASCRPDEDGVCCISLNGRTGEVCYLASLDDNCSYIKACCDNVFLSKP
ncbi:hypothetical protein PM082_009722 [Marasmius tenuissimus]|nr:hypothetical protein PM082_009722 [Marasmius tenuissimus]